MFCKDLESVSFYLWSGLTNWKYVSTFKATHLTILISISLMDNWTTKYYDNSLSDKMDDQILTKLLTHQIPI